MHFPHSFWNLQLISLYWYTVWILTETFVYTENTNWIIIIISLKHFTGRLALPPHTLVMLLPSCRVPSAKSLLHPNTFWAFVELTVAKADGNIKLYSQIQSARLVRSAYDGEHAIALAVVAATIGWRSREAHDTSLCWTGLLICAFVFISGAGKKPPHQICTHCIQWIEVVVYIHMYACVYILYLDTYVCLLIMIKNNNVRVHTRSKLCCWGATNTQITSQSLTKSLPTSWYCGIPQEGISQIAVASNNPDSFISGFDFTSIYRGSISKNISDTNISS